MFKWNIRNQILGSGVFGLIVIAGVIGYFYNFAEVKFIDNSKSLLEISSARAGDQLNQHFKDISSNFETWTKEDMFGLAIEFSTTDELEAQFSEWVNATDRFSVIALIDKTGTVLQAAKFNDLSGTIGTIKNTRLADFQSIKNPEQASITFTESKTLASLGYDNSNTYLFYRPAFSSAGEHVGAVIAYANWNRIDEAISEFARDLKERDFPGSWSALINPSASELVTALEGELTIAKDELIQNLVTLTNQSSGSIDNIVDIAENTFLVSTVQLLPPQIEGINSGSETPVLMLSIPEEAVMAQLNSTLSTITIMGIFCTLIVLLVSYWISRSISGRVNKVSQLAQSMSVGEINQQIDISGNDEIGELGESFKKLTNYISDMTSVAEKIADGDLRMSVEPKSDKDQLGCAFQKMVASLSNVIRKLNESAQELSTAVLAINSSAQKVSTSTEEQEARISQISTAIEEMTANILESSTNAGEASDGARNAAQTAGDGGEIVAQTVQGMQNIADVVRKSAQSIADLAKAADQIGSITSVIDDIADQTNLLALNAAIEAARAGEQGRGFAVVADEVRKLAERTGSATGEINSMVKGIQTQTEEAVNSMETGIQEVDRGREMADKAGNSLSEIVTLSQRVVDMIQQIATGTEEQSSAAEEISKTVESVNNSSRDSAKAAKESEEEANKLNIQAEELQQIVGQFKVSNNE